MNPNICKIKQFTEQTDTKNFECKTIELEPIQDLTLIQIGEA